MSSEQRFVNSLVRLARTRDEDPSARATLAMLRRGLGKEPGDAPEMYRFVQPRLAAVEEWDERRYYLVASLFAAHQINWPESNTIDPRRANIGASFRRLIKAKPETSNSTQRRFEALLECDREELPSHLRHAVSLLKSGEIWIHWEQLLRDIARWDREGKPVQRQWARAFWSERSDDESADANVTDETSGEQTEGE